VEGRLAPLPILSRRQRLRRGVRPHDDVAGRGAKLRNGKSSATPDRKDQRPERQDDQPGNGVRRAVATPSAQAIGPQVDVPMSMSGNAVGGGVRDEGRFQPRHGEDAQRGGQDDDGHSEQNFRAGRESNGAQGSSPERKKRKTSHQIPPQEHGTANPPNQINI